MSGPEEEGPGVGRIREGLEARISNPELRAAVETHFAVWAEASSPQARLGRVAIDPLDFAVLLAWLIPVLRAGYDDDDGLRDVHLAEIFFGIGMAFERGRR